MKIYLYLQTDGFNEKYVERAFASLKKAVDFVRKEIFAGKAWYDGRDEAFLESAADDYVKRHFDTVEMES